MSTHRKKSTEIDAWQVSESSNPPAWAESHYIGFVAQGAALVDGDWIVRIPAGEGGSIDFVKAERFAEIYEEV